MSETTPLKKQARADLDALRRIFTVPDDASTLAKIERNISDNLMGFLRDHIVAGDLAPEALEKDFSETEIPEEPVFVSEQADFLLEKVVAQSVHVSNPSFIGHMTSAVPYFMLTLAKIMTGLNQNLVKIETSKVFTPLERQVIGMLHRLVYGGRQNTDEAFYKTQTQNAEVALGSFCSGGTVANLTCLWAARNRLLGPNKEFAGVQKAGLVAALRHYGYTDLAILVSKRGHYSLRKSADLLGIGHANVIAIPTTDNFKVDVKQLERRLLELKAARVAIVGVVGVAGTTETGHIDPLDQLADLCEREKIHFHVDAAWGGPVLFSRRHAHLLKGIERADSVIIDAHKQLYAPVGAGIALFRDPQLAKSIEHHAKYIIRRGSRDLGQFTLEGSRSGMALLVHSGLRIMAKSGYELLIDLGIGKASQFARMILSQPDFELVSPPETNLLTYRYVPEEIRQRLAHAPRELVAAANDILSDLTARIQKRQRAHGKTFVSRTSIEVPIYDLQVLTVFRVVLANPLTTRQILHDVLEEQREHARAVLAESDALEGWIGLLDGKKESANA